MLIISQRFTVFVVVVLADYHYAEWWICGQQQAAAEEMGGEGISDAQTKGKHRF